LARTSALANRISYFAIEECIRTAQRGGVGVAVYFRKEGRALGDGDDNI